MAEAIATVGLVAAILQFIEFSTKVIKRVDEFKSSIDEMPRTFQRITIELPLLTTSLERIKERTEHEVTDEKTTSAVLKVVEACQQQVALLESILDDTLPCPEDSSWDRRKKAFLSLGKDKKIEEIAESLGRYVRILTLHQVTERPKTLDSPSKPVFLVPFDRNDNFVGREDLFLQLEETFKVKEDVQPKAAICGLGGIGSSIATDAGRKALTALFSGSMDLVRPGSKKDINKIAQVCGLVAQGDGQADVTGLVQTWLANQCENPWLMVVDNLDDEDILFRDAACNGRTPWNCIQHTGNGSLLYTTRNRDIAVDLANPGTPIVVPSLSSAEGKSLLRSRLKRGYADGQAAELLEELEYIPLAISQAAAFMVKRGKTIAQYLEIYRKSDSTQIRLFSQKFSDHGRPFNFMESVTKTWVITFESIRKKDPRAADLLALMSYFDRYRIPSDSINSEHEDILDFEDSIAIRRAFSLIECGHFTTSFNMHRLVQLVTKVWLMNDGQEIGDEWAAKALSSITLKFPIRQTGKDSDYILKCIGFIPHAEAILKHDFAPAREEVELDRATLLMHTAGYAHWLREYEDAKTRTEKAFQIRERLLGEKHPDTLRSMAQLFQIYQLPKEHYYYPVEMGERLSKLQKEVLGDEHPETISTLCDLAVMTGCRAKFERSDDLLQKSEVMHRNAWEYSRQILGPEIMITFRCLEELANLLTDTEKYEEAEEKLHELIHLQGVTLGADHPSTLCTIHNLADVFREQKKDDEAEQTYRYLLALGEKEFHFDDLMNTFEAIRQIVKMLQKQGKPEVIRQFLDELLANPEFSPEDSAFLWENFLDVVPWYRDSLPQ